MRFKEIGNSVNGLNTVMKALSTGSVAAGASFDSLSKAQQEYIISSNALSATQKQVILGNAMWIPSNEGVMMSTQGVAKSTLEEQISIQSLAVSEGVATTATGVFGTAMTAFGTAVKGAAASIKAFLLTNPVGWILLAIGSIGILKKAIDALITTADEAKEMIDADRQEYDDTKSSIESMNSELETTKSRIEELKSKGKLTFTEKEELQNLKDQNAELEKSIDLENKKAQKKASKVVSDVRDNEKTLNKDFNEDFDSYNRCKDIVKDDKKNGKKYVDSGDVDIDDYERIIQEEQDELDKMQAKVLDNIEDFEKNKKSIVDKYNGAEIDTWSKSDQDLYKSISDNLDKAYKAVYTNDEYNKFVVEPVFSTEGLDGLEDELLSYFATGGSKNTTQLSEVFGADIINALKAACQTAGVDFDKMIGDMYNNASQKLNSIAPIIKNPNSRYDAETNKTNKNSNAKREYFDSLSDDDKTLIVDAKIPDSVKNGTVDDLKDFLSDLQGEADKNSVEVSVTTASDSLGQMAEDVKNLDNAYKEFKEGGFSNMDTVNGMSDAFKGLDSYQDFVKVAGDVNSSSEQIQKSFNNLMTEYIYTSDAMKGLTSETVGLYETQLTAQGITNATEICTSDYAKALIYANEKGIDLTNATWQEISAMANEQGVAEATRVALANMALEKWEASHTGVGDAQDIQDLYDLCKQAGVAIDTLNQLKSAKSALSGDIPGMSSEAAKAQAKTAEKTAKSEVKKKNADYKPTANYSNYTPKSSSGSKGSSGSSDKKTKETLDHIEKRLDKVTDKASKAKDMIEKLLSFGDKKKQTEKAIKANEKAIESEEKAAKKYNAYAEKVAKKDVKGKNGVSQKTLEKYEKLVRNGSLGKDAIKTITNEKLKTAIKDYESWYNKAKSCKEEIKTLRETVSDLYDTLYNTPIDKAEDKIDKLSKAMSLLDSKMSNLKIVNSNGSINTSDVSKYGSKIVKNYESQADAVKDEYLGKDGTKKAYTSAKSDATKAVSKAKAGKVGLTKKQLDTIKKNLKSGKSISENLLNKITDTNLYKKCVAFNEALAANTEAKANYKQSQEDLQSNINQAQKDVFDKIQSAYENQLSLMSAQEQALSNQIDMLEAKGAIVSAQYYKDSIANEQSKLAVYEQEKASLQAQLANIAVGTDEWYDAQNALIDVDSEIASCNSNIVDMNNNITELADTLHDKLLNNIQKVSDEMDFFAGLVSDKDLTDKDTGNLTNEGLLTLGSYTSGYNAQFIKSQETKALLDEMKANYANGKYSYTDMEGNERDYQSAEQMQEKIDELYSDWRDQIAETKDYEQKAIDLISEKYNTELDYLQELIDKKKDALQAEKDLYDYQRQIADKTKNIVTIQKQITALSGDTSEESMSKVQQLQSKLEESQSDLKDTQYDKMISQQSDMLDKLYSEYEDLMNNLLKNTDKLIQDAIDATNNNQVAINNMKDALCEKYDYVEDTTGKLFDNSGIAITNLDAIKNAFDLSQSGLYGVSINSGIASIIQAINGINISATPAVANAGLQQSSGATASTSASGTPAIQVEDPNIASQAAEAAKLSNMVSKNVTHKNEKGNVEYSDEIILVKQALAKLGYTSSTNVNSGTWGAGFKKDLAKFKKDHNMSSTSGTVFGDTFTKALIQALQLKGFRNGGIAKIKSGILSQGESGITLARNGEGFVSPEDVPTIQSLLKNIPTLANVASNLAKIDLPDYSNMLKNATSSSTNIGDVTVLVDGSSVTDIDSFVDALGNPKVQKAVQSVTTDLLTTKGSRLGVNKFKH